MISKLIHRYNFLYWQVVFFMEYFAQTNVFARIRTIFAHLIIGCTIRYPKIDNLHYVATMCPEQH